MRKTMVNSPVITKALIESVRFSDKHIGGYLHTPLDGINSNERWDESKFLDFLVEQYETIHSNADAYGENKTKLKKEQRTVDKQLAIMLTDVAENQSFWYTERKIWSVENNDQVDDKVINRVPHQKRQKRLVSRLKEYSHFFDVLSSKRRPAIKRAEEVKLFSKQEMNFYLKGTKN